MSSPIDPYVPLLIYLGIWVAIFLVGVILKADKHGVIVKPYYLMLKTIVFNSWMERLGGRFRRAWLTYFDIGAAMGIGLIVLAIYGYVRNAVNLTYHSAQAGPAILIVPLPGLTIGWDIFPYILISIAALLIPHEISHGIASVLDKVPIKSSGVFMAVFLPGGFVEIDEENLAKQKARTKLRVFAAGSFTNVISWLLVILVLTATFQPTPSGVLVTGFWDGAAAQKGGIPQWSVITSINSTRIAQQADLTKVINASSPGSLLIVRTSNGQSYRVFPTPSDRNSSQAVLGAVTVNYFAMKVAFLPEPAAFQFFSAFSWMSLILLNVALVNMLPLFPFDGDRYFDTVLTQVGLKKTKNVRIVVSIASLTLLLLNVTLSYSLFGTIFPR